MDASLSTYPLVHRHRKPSSLLGRYAREQLRKYILLTICFLAVVGVAIFDYVMYRQYLKLEASRPQNASKIKSPPRVDQQPVQLCNSSACVWLQGYLETSNTRPCEDFNAFVCSDKKEAFLTQGSQPFVRAITTLYQTLKAPNEALESAVFLDCLQGKDDISDVVLHKENWSVLGQDCNVAYPHVPFAVSEMYFRNVTNATVAGFKKFLDANVKGLERFLDRARSKDIRITSGHWAVQGAKRVAKAAVCHFIERLRPHDDVTTYVTLWKVLYFSPFLGFLYKDLHQNSLLHNSRDRACLQLMDDNFPAETRSKAETILKNWNPSFKEEFQSSVVDAIHRLQDYFRSWSPGYRPEIFAELSSVKITLTNENVTRGHPTTPLLDSCPAYSRKKNTLAIPVGLLALLLVEPSKVDTVLIPYIGAKVFGLLLQTANVASWPAENRALWNKHLSCMSRQLADNRSLTDISTAHVALSPLYVAYRDHLQKQHPNIVKLHPNFTNEELFFVLWAKGRCGRSADVVNWPLRHSERFTKAFHCVTGQGMVAKERCPFWVH
ncbi:uncharacterized protein LOC135401606 [Ornithodoros turicata]|uniref:uncharacterized protein LOC135401606 n=1 Tax=Ornithodoros turicata TaxID=34597 RepID=UPI0031390D0C